MPRMKVLLLTRYGRKGASSRVRSFQFLPYLRAQGIEVRESILIDDRCLTYYYENGHRPISAVLGSYIKRTGSLLAKGRYDLLWIEKELFPWFPDWLETLLIGRLPYVVDYDDATFHSYDSHPNRMVVSLLGRKIDSLMSNASLVIAGNSYLADRAKSVKSRRVEIVASVIDLTRYPNAVTRRPDVFTIGWIGSPSTATNHLPLVEGALRKLCDRGCARVVLIGASENPFANLPAILRPWSEATEVQEMQAFDVGIMPLPDRPWERGKCGYKLIQYMGCSLPVVGSPVGINRELIEDRVNGFLAQGPEAWARALQALRDDPDMRARMGREGRKRVEENYSLQHIAPRLVELLRSAT